MNIISTIKHIINGVNIDSLFKRITELESELMRIKDENVRKTVEIAHFVERIETLNEDLTREQNRSSLAVNKQKEIAVKLSESEEKITSLKAQKKTLMEMQKLMSEDNSSLKANIVGRDNKIINLQKEKDKLAETITKLQEKSSILEQKNKELEKTLKESESVNIRNITEIERLNTEIDDINEELDREHKISESTNKTLHELTTLTEKKDSTIEDLKSQLIVESQANDSLKANINDLQSAYDTVKFQFDSLQKKYDTLYNELEELKTKPHEPIDDNKGDALLKDTVLNSEVSLRELAEDGKEIGNAEELAELTSEDITEDSNVDNIADNENNEHVNFIMTNDDKVYDSIDSTQNNSENENTSYNAVENYVTDSFSIENTNISDKELTNEDLNCVTDVDTNATETGLEEFESDVSSRNANDSLDSTVNDTNEEDSNSDTNNLLDDKDEKTEDISEPIEEISDEDDVLADNTLPFVYDNRLIPAEKLSIPEVYDVKEEKIINSKEFFSQNENELILWRRNLQEEYLMGHARFICPECKQPVKISGHKLFRGKVCYFAHFKDSNDCPYKTGTNRTKEEIERLKYSLVQESERHKRLKAFIASALQGNKSKAMGVENVECEKRINSDIPYLKWRRPDVYAEYNGRRYVFELQLSTTFVSVIVDRDIFYRLNDYNIIWIFNFEDNEEYVNLYNLMCKDIYYANKRNIFIFDADAEEKSKEKGELVLKCRWLDENEVWSPVKYVTLEMFQYDEEYHKPFIFDADKAYLEKHPEYVERRKQLENSREYLLKAFMERQKSEEELEKRKNEERTNLQLKLLNTDKSVERFRSGTKYGYQFEGVIILPAKYTSAENIGENGYAQVGFNRKIGLVRKDGKEVLPVEYRKINVINARHGIVMAQYKRIDLLLGDESFTLRSEFDDKEQTIIKEGDNEKTNFILQTNTYRYSYSQSYYGDHPVCHKNFDGYSKSTLFTLLEKNDYCIIWVNGTVYLLSNNRLSSVNGNYSDIVSIGIDKLFIAKNSNSNLWGVIDLQGNIVTGFKYAKLIPTGSEYLIVKYTNNSSIYGVVDYQGRIFIEPIYEGLIYLNSDRFAFLKGHLWGICDRMGNILHEAEYTYIRGMESGGLWASTLDSYSSKWKVLDNVPSYYDDNVKLCLLNDKGTIAYTEQDMGQYHIRHSGDLFSILSSDNKELVNYILSYVEFVTETTAIIKNTEGNSGFFVDEKCIFWTECKNIEQLAESVFQFENIHGYKAIGDYSGPISNFSFCHIKAVDTCHFIASQKNEWNNYVSGNYVIINKTGKSISAFFSSIDDFEDGYANAIYQGRKGVIDVAGVMQEKTIKNYGDYILCEKFENYYFRDKEAKIVSDEYQKVEHLIDMFFIVRKNGEANVRLFSLEMKKTTDSSFSNITHLVENIFVTQSPSSLYLRNPYQLYKGTEQLTSESYSSVTLLKNGYIALQKSNGKEYDIQKKWKLSNKDGIILNDREYDSITEANEDSFKVYIDGHEGLIDLDGNLIVERKACGNNYVITHCFADCGLEDPEGNVIFSLEEHFSSIDFTDDSMLIVCKNSKYALYSIDGKQRTRHKFSSITYETNNRYAVVMNNIEGYIDSLGNYIESSAVSVTDDGITIFVIMGKYGLRDSNGNIIISPEYASISYLIRRLLVVKKGAFVALFNTEGIKLTKFQYSEISCNEDGSIQAIRNNIIGRLDDQGNEIADILHFNGGYLQSLFDEYSVINDAGEIIVPVGYSKIELLDKEGIFALWKGTKVAISNISKEKTEAIYESVKSIGNGFYVVSRTISKKTRTRHTGYGYRGNPYTYFSTNIVEEKRYGIIDGQLRTIIPCKYISISDFDSEQNLTTTNSNGEKKIISLQNLKKKVTRASELSIDMEYNVKVQSFMAIGLIIKIQGNSYVIHKKYLFKEKKDFKKGELIIAKFLGYDKNGHPLWTTKPLSIKSEEKSDTITINKE